MANIIGSRARGVAEIMAGAEISKSCPESELALFRILEWDTSNAAESAFRC